MNQRMTALMNRIAKQQAVLWLVAVPLAAALVLIVTPQQRVWVLRGLAVATLVYIVWRFATVVRDGFSKIRVIGSGASDEDASPFAEAICARRISTPFWDVS